MLTISEVKSRIAVIAPYCHQAQLIREIVSKYLIGGLDVINDGVDSIVA